MIRVIDLFSGIGGFSLGLRMAGGFRTVQFVEIDPFCRRVLEKNFPGAPVHDDIRTYRPADGAADLICGGFPCQPFSHAGQQRGLEDDRDLWPEMFRVIQAVRPAWVVGENVTGFVRLALDRSIADLESIGYACRAFVIPACAVAAPHRRERVWIVGHADREDESGQLEYAALSGKQALADSQRDRLERLEPPRSAARTIDGPSHGCDPCRWEPEPRLGRVANGIPQRVDRLRSLGNAVVPQVVAEIGRAILSASAKTATPERRPRRSTRTSA